MGKIQRKHPETGAWIPLDEYERVVAQAKADEGEAGADDGQEDLADMSRKDLYDMAKDMGLDVTWNDVTKGDLVDMIEEARG